MLCQYRSLTPLRACALISITIILTHTAGCGSSDDDAPPPDPFAGQTSLHEKGMLSVATLAYEYKRVHHIAHGDFDHDGDVDLAFYALNEEDMNSYYKSLIVIEQLIPNKSWALHHISDDGRFTAGVHYDFSQKPAFLPRRDGNGSDLAAYRHGQLTLMSKSAKGTNWEPTQQLGSKLDHTVVSAVLGVADFDGDGDSTLIEAIRGRLTLWDQQSDDSWSETTIDEFPGIPQDLVVADLNGDSRPDILAHNGQQFVTYTTDATGQRWTRSNLNRHALDIGAFDIIDWDKDGDTDIIVGLNEAARIGVLENSGESQYWAFTPIIDDTYPVHYLMARDLDTDGDLDFLYGSEGFNSPFFAFSNADDPSETYPYEFRSINGTSSIYRGFFVDLLGNETPELIYSFEDDEGLVMTKTGMPPGTADSRDPLPIHPRALSPAIRNPGQITFNKDGHSDALVGYTCDSREEYFLEENAPRSALVTRCHIGDNGAIGTANTEIRSDYCESRAGIFVNLDANNRAEFHTGDRYVREREGTWQFSSDDDIGIAYQQAVSLKRADNLEDLVLFAGSGQHDILEPSATLSPFNALPARISATADIDGDGRTDVVSFIDGQLSWLRQPPDAHTEWTSQEVGTPNTFNKTATVEILQSSIEDTWIIAVVDRSANSAGLYHQANDWSLEKLALPKGTISGSTSVDMDNDGDDDLVISNLDFRDFGSDDDIRRLIWYENAEGWPQHLLHQHGTWRRIGLDRVDIDHDGRDELVAHEWDLRGDSVKIFYSHIGEGPLLAPIASQ